jgi:hypothetical protein
LKNWPRIAPDVLGPFRLPKHHLDTARFGLKALSPADPLANKFHSIEARGLCAGMAAPSSQPLSKLTTSAIGLVLSIAGHLKKVFFSLSLAVAALLSISTQSTKTASSPSGCFQDGESYRSCTLKPDLAPPYRNPLRNRDRTI